MTYQGTNGLKKEKKKQGANAFFFKVCEYF